MTARRVVEHAIGEQLNGKPLERDEETKNPHAVALGRLGGKVGGIARAKALTKAERRNIASMAAKARWHGK